MSVEKSIEITSSSSEGLKKAVTEGVERANNDIGKVSTAKVTEIVAVVENGNIIDWQISMLIKYT